MFYARFARNQRVNRVDDAVNFIVRWNVNCAIGGIIASFAFRCRKFSRNEFFLLLFFSFLVLIC